MGWTPREMNHFLAFLFSWEVLAFGEEEVDFRELLSVLTFQFKLASHASAQIPNVRISFQSSSVNFSPSERRNMREEEAAKFDFGFLVGNYGELRSFTKCSVPFEESILSWIGTHGQCLAAPHLFISTLEPDQLTQAPAENFSFSSKAYTTKKVAQYFRPWVIYESKINNNGELSILLPHFRGVEVVESMARKEDSLEILVD